jgi:hypothetical protein
MGTFPDVTLEAGERDDVESIQRYITVTALSDVPDENTVTVVVVGGLGPRTRAWNVTSANVEPFTLGVPRRYVNHDLLHLPRNGEALELEDIALHRKQGFNGLLNHLNRHCQNGPSVLSNCRRHGDKRRNARWLINGASRAKLTTTAIVP